MDLQSLPFLLQHCRSMKHGETLRLRVCFAMRGKRLWFMIFSLTFQSFRFPPHRLHYHMMHNNYPRQRGIHQLFIWHVELTLPRSKADIGPFWYCLEDCTFSEYSIMILYVQASVFVQSHVRAHVELMWLLSSVAPVGWLNRMIQFKEKSLKAVRL